MKRFTLLAFTFSLFFAKSFAQNNSIHSMVETKATGTTAGNVPFWFRSNQYGSVPLRGASLSAIARITKSYDTTKNKIFDWGFGLEGRGNIGYKTEAFLTEAYAKAKLGVFQLRAGRTKQVMGLQDTTLSSGSFTESGNALGVPKLEISVPQFANLLGGKLFAFKGTFAHGWMGEVPIQDIYSNVKSATAYLHQASLYVRLAKPEWKLQLFGGFNHQVVWGSEKEMYGNKFTLSTTQAYWHVISGKTYEDGNGIKSKLGNHLGSIDMGMNYDFANFSLFAYRQNFYDEGALYSLANIRDGLNGLSLTNRKTEHKSIGWHKIVVEFLSTKNQAGEMGSKYTRSGDENYYNNYVYAEGWSYKGVGLGTPFISTRNSTRKGLPNDPTDYFNNNRVVAFHLGIEAWVKAWTLLSKLSFSNNYGTFGTSLTGHSLGRAYTAPRYGLFKKLQQFSGYLEAKKTLRSGFVLGFMAAHDDGGLLNRSTGLSVSLSKQF